MASARTWSEPQRVGPGVQFALQSLCFATLARAEVPAPVLAEAAERMVTAAGLQVLEVRTAAWTAPSDSSRWPRASPDSSGRCYLRVLWEGTALARAGGGGGAALGVAAHVAEDIRSGDARFHGMPEEDRHRGAGLGARGSRRGRAAARASRAWTLSCARWSPTSPWKSTW